MKGDLRGDERRGDKRKEEENVLPTPHPTPPHPTKGSKCSKGPDHAGALALRATL